MPDANSLTKAAEVSNMAVLQQLAALASVATPCGEPKDSALKLAIPSLRWLDGLDCQVRSSPGTEGQGCKAVQQMSEMNMD